MSNSLVGRLFASLWGPFWGAFSSGRILRDWKLGKKKVPLLSEFEGVVSWQFAFECRNQMRFRFRKVSHAMGTGREPLLEKGFPVADARTDFVMMIGLGIVLLFVGNVAQNEVRSGAVRLLLDHGLELLRCLREATFSKGERRKLDLSSWICGILSENMGEERLLGAPVRDLVKGERQVGDRHQRQHGRKNSSSLS